MISLHEGLLCSFLPEKRTKNLVALKTRFGIQAIVWYSGLLSRLFLFHSFHFLALWPKSGLPGGSDNLERQDGPPRNVFFHRPLSRGKGV